MKTLISTLVLLSIVSSCGYEMPEQQEPTEEEKEVEEELPPTEEETVEREPAEEKQARQGDNIEVNVDVNVEINQYDGYAAKWLYQGAPATWEEANDQAPEGYRLPTRAELVDGYDNGEFEDVVGLVVWSTTELVNQPGYIIGMNLGTGSESRFYEGIKLHVVYVLR